MGYQMTSWQHAKKRTLDGVDQDFARYLRGVSRPAQIAYSRIMQSHDGIPLGIEYRHESREAWAFLLPNVSGDDAWRIQYFDPDGFSRHACYTTSREAVEEMVQEGYITQDAGALDRHSLTKRWSIGVKRSSVMQRHNSGEITWADAIGLMQAIS